MSPSYRIVFYVSGHGFGHTSRVIQIIQAVLQAAPRAHIVVKTSAPHFLFTLALQGRCELVDLQCDAGVVQIDSLNLDPSVSIRRAVEFQGRLPKLTAAEAAYLHNSGATLTVGDIPPLAVAAASKAGIPSVLIGNFTWDWIYEGYRDDAAPGLARDIRRLYRDASAVLRLPMAGGFEELDSMTRDIPFVARRSQRSENEVREVIGLPPRGRGKPLVLMAFGGHGLAGLDTAALRRLKDYTVATTDVSVQGRAITQADLLYITQKQLYDQGLRFDDLVRAADVVVTKPGYGIISEAIANEAALLYTSRGQFVEYDVLVKEMPRFLRVEFIEQDDLLKGNWNDALKRVLTQPAPPEKPPLNGAEIAAEEILRLVTKNE